MATQKLNPRDLEGSILIEMMPAFSLTRARPLYIPATLKIIPSAEELLRTAYDLGILPSLSLSEFKLNPSPPIKHTIYLDFSDPSNKTK